MTPGELEKAFGINSEPHPGGCGMLYAIPAKTTEVARGLFVLSQNYAVNQGGTEWLRFAFFEFAMSDTDGSNTMGSLMLWGNGFPALRECRHTYWGEEGYIFYPNAEHITAAMEWLKQHFDMD